MRILLPVLALIFGGTELWAQTNTGHYVPKSADMRIVGGKMYNRVLSTNWTTLPAAGATLAVLEVGTNGVVAQIHQDGKAGEKLLIKHYPTEKTLAKGAEIKVPFRAMPVESVKYGSETVAAYDCGLANTKENRKTLVNGPIHAGPD